MGEPVDGGRHSGDVPPVGPDQKPSGSTLSWEHQTFYILVPKRSIFFVIRIQIVC